MHTIQIKTTDGIVGILANVVQDGLAVHRVHYKPIKINKNIQGVYTVTHRQSGKMCYSKPLSYKDACKLMKKLLALDVNWYGDEEYILSQLDVIKECIAKFDDELYGRVNNG